MKTSKKINAGDTLTVGDLTDDYLGAVIEVETLVDITYRFTLGALGDDWYSQKTLWTTEVRVGSFYPNAQVTIITPPQVVQPDEPAVLGQLVRIEGYDDLQGVVADPGSDMSIVNHEAIWCSWEEVLDSAGDRQIIVSDPPRWPDETPEAPERIGFGAWPDDDTHLREWEWVDRDDDAWRWRKEHCALDGLGWGRSVVGPRYRRPRFGPWTRGNRVDSETGPKAGDVFTTHEWRRTTPNGS